jgi:hypothetical protein
MMRMLKNKKGLDYAAVMVLVVIVVVIYLFIKLSTIIEPFQVKIGESQVALLNAYQAGESALLYVDQSARLSAYWALDEIAQKGAVFGTPCDIVDEGNKKISAWSKAGADCLVTVQPYESLNSAFNSRMNIFADQYKNASLPKDNYELFIQKGSITGTAVKPAFVWVKPPAGMNQAFLMGIAIPWTKTPLIKAPIGEYSFKPSFTVPVNADIEIYNDLKKEVKTFYDCTNNYSPDECLKQIKGFTYSRSSAKPDYLICTAKNPMKNPYGSMSDIVFAIYLPEPKPAPSATV